MKKPVEEMTDMERFAVFLRYAENPEYRDVVNRVIESKEGLAVAGEVLMNISRDERERAIFRSRRIALADQESNIITAERRGAAEERVKWQGIVDEQASEIAQLRALLDENK